MSADIDDGPFDGIALAVFDESNQHMCCVRWFNELTRRASCDFANIDDAWRWRRMVGDDRLLTMDVGDVAWRWASDGGHDCSLTDWPCYDVSEVARVMDAYRRASGAWGRESRVDGVVRMHPHRFGDGGDLDRDEVLRLFKRTHEFLRKPRGTFLNALGTTWHEDRPHGGPAMKVLPSVIALLRSLGHAIDVRSASEIRMEVAQGSAQ